MIEDGVHAGRIDTAILFSRTASGGRVLRRRVVDPVPRPVAPALEDVEQAEPVADLVHGRGAEVVVFVVGAGHRAGKDLAAVGVEVLAAGLDVMRESADAEKAVLHVGDEVEV